MEEKYNDNKNEGVPVKCAQAPDLIIEAGLLLTMAEGDPVKLDHRVEIRGGVIREIAPIDQPNNNFSCVTERINAAGCVVMPGLINGHTHAAMTLFRGLSDDLPLKAWLFDRIFPAEAAYLDPGTVYIGTLLACMEMLSSGTTCFIDGYFFEDSALRAARDAGIRAVLAQGVIDFPAPGVPDPSMNLKVAASFLSRWNGVSSLLKPAVFCHSPLTCSASTLREAFSICRDFASPLFLHLSETVEEVIEIEKKTGMRPVFYLDSLGILTDQLVAVHCTHVVDDEIGMLFAKETKAVHVPSSNMKLGSGMAPVAAMVRAGMRPALGTDGCASNNGLDMFREMDIAAKAAKIKTGDSTALTALDVLKSATIWAAETAGLGNLVGTLEVGKRADIIVIDCNRAHLRPLYDPVSSLVYSANGSDVMDVIVDGRVVLRDGRLTSLSPLDVIREVNRVAHLIGKGLPRGK